MVMILVVAVAMRSKLGFLERPRKGFCADSASVACGGGNGGQGVAMLGCWQCRRQRALCKGGGGVMLCGSSNVKKRSWASAGLSGIGIGDGSSAGDGGDSGIYTMVVVMVVAVVAILVRVVVVAVSTKVCLKAMGEFEGESIAIGPLVIVVLVVAMMTRVNTTRKPFVGMLLCDGCVLEPWVSGACDHHHRYHRHHEHVGLKKHTTPNFESFLRLPGLGNGNLL